MEMNEIFTRIQLKYDSYNAWKTNNPTLLPGEVAIAKLVDENVTIPTDETKNAPVLFKVGPGVFNDLPWVSGLAADVYAWAKAKEIIADGEGNAVTGVTVRDNADGTKSVVLNKGATFATKGELEELREGLEADTNTTYNFSVPTEGVDAGKLLVQKKEIGDAGWTRVGAYDFVTPDELTGILTSYYTKNEVDALIQGVRDDMPTELGVMTVDKTDGTAIEVDNTDAKNPKVGLKIASHQGSGVFVTQSNDGLKVEVSHPTITVLDVEDAAVDKQFVDYIKLDGGIVKAEHRAIERADIANALLANEGTIKADAIEANTTLTVGGKAVATEEYVDRTVAGAVDYLGVANALTDLSVTAGKGDFYRVGTEIKSGDTVFAYAGDLIIAEKDAPAQQIDGTNWVAIHSGDGDISNVVAGSGLTGGGSTGEVIISHGAKPTAGTAHTNILDGATRKYVTGIDVDAFGHIAAVHTQEEQSDIQDLSGYKTVQEAKEYTGSTVKTVTSVKQNENGEITEVNFEDIGKIANAEHADEADVAEKLDNNTLTIDNSILWKSAAGGVDVVWESNNVNIITGSSVADAQLTVQGNDGTNVSSTVIKNGDITAETITVDEATIDGVEIKELIKAEAANLDVVVLAESQKYTDDAIDELHAIATSGSIYDVAEGHNVSTGTDSGVKYLVFNCGSATTVI